MTEPEHEHEQVEPQGEEPPMQAPEGSPLQPGPAAHVVDPATGEAHTGQ